MRLEIEKCPHPIVEAELRHTFAVATRELKMDRQPYYVKIIFDHKLVGSAYTIPTVRMDKGNNPYLEMGFPVQRPECDTSLGHILCHELVHAKQIIRGDLYQDGDNMVWQGKRIPRKFLELVINGVMANALPSSLYKSIPWEKEAFAKMDTLWEKVKQEGCVVNIE